MYNYFYNQLKTYKTSQILTMLIKSLNLTTVEPILYKLKTEHS